MARPLREFFFFVCDFPKRLGVPGGQTFNIAIFMHFYSLIFVLFSSFLLISIFKKGNKVNDAFLKMDINCRNKKKNENKQWKFEVWKHNLFVNLTSRKHPHSHNPEHNHSVYPGG